MDAPETPYPDTALDALLSQGVVDKALETLSDEPKQLPDFVIERQISFLEVFAEVHGIVTLACQSIGINRSTYYEWRKSDVSSTPYGMTFKQATDEILESRTDLVENVIIQGILDGDLQTARWYMGTKGRARGYGAEPPEDNTDSTLNVIGTRRAKFEAEALERRRMEDVVSEQ